ncbi:unnamed protein product [Sphagnum jensenii]
MQIKYVQLQCDFVPTHVSPLFRDGVIDPKEWGESKGWIKVSEVGNGNFWRDVCPECAKLKEVIEGWRKVAK